VLEESPFVLDREGEVCIIEVVLVLGLVEPGVGAFVGLVLEESPFVMDRDGEVCIIASEVVPDVAPFDVEMANWVAVNIILVEGA